MSRRFSARLLRRLRNEIPVDRLIQERLLLPCKVSEGFFRFLCPLCEDFNTATNPRTNLARCFRCRRNFNPIDLLILVEHVSFLDAVGILRRLLPPETKTSPCRNTTSAAGQTLSGGIK